MQSLKYFTKGGKDKTNKKNYKPTTSNQAYTLPERKDLASNIWLRNETPLQQMKVELYQT